MPELLLSRNADLLARKEILNFIFVVDQRTFVDWIYQNSSHPAGIPVVAVLGLVPIPIEG